MPGSQPGTAQIRGKFEIGGKKETFKVIDTQVEANKAFGFFSTLKGQKLVGGMWMVGSALGALYQIAPHWFFLNKVKDIYQSFSKGFPTLIKEEINEVTVKPVKLFVLTPMQSPMHGGCLADMPCWAFLSFIVGRKGVRSPLSR